MYHTIYMPTLSLIIPAYNEEKRIGPFLADVGGYAKRHPSDIWEVIVVDDGSSDETFWKASSVGQYIPGFKIEQHEKNQGKGAAVKTGVMKATGDLVVFMDADGATGIEELPKMLSALEAADIAIGNRWMKGAQTQRHSLLRALSGFMYRNYMALFGLGAIDTMCGFKGYKAKVAKDLYADLGEKRWLFDTEIAYRAVQRKHSITNFPIRWESKDGSKLDTKTLIKSALNILPLVLRVQQQERHRT